MYQDGYKAIMNIDFSDVVIDDMKKKCENLAGLECECPSFFFLAFPFLLVDLFYCFSASTTST
jgi:hypothetical protein